MSATAAMPPPPTDADAASMSPGVRALVLIHCGRARLTKRERARLPAAPASGGVMYGPDDAATTITAADLARLTPNAARWVCAALWLSDFKRARVEGDGGVSTQVQFGYAPGYGGHAVDPADLEHLSLRGARLRWKGAHPVSRMVRRIEVPLTHTRYVAVVWGR